MNDKLKQAVNSALDTYYGEVSLSDVIQEFNGSVSSLARQFAGINETGQLPKKGTPERRHYDSQYRIIHKYLDYGKYGKTPSTRNPANKDAQKKLKSALATKRKPDGMSITVAGEITVSEDVRDRSVSIDSDKYPIDIDAFLDAVQQGNEQGAFSEVFHSYCRNMQVTALDSVDIDFSE